MSPEELRRAAMEALGEHADERARDVLRRAAIVVDGTYTWGRGLEGVRVTLAVDAGELGMVRAAPAVLDALNVAVAAAVVTEPGARLIDFAIRWLPAARASTSAYRDAPPGAPETAFRDALLAYLDGAGDHALRGTLADADVDAGIPDEVLVRLPKDAADALRSDAYAMARLTAAVRDLLGRAEGRVRVRARD